MIKSITIISKIGGVDLAQLRNIIRNTLVEIMNMISIMIRKDNIKGMNGTTEKDNMSIMRGGDQVLISIRSILIHIIKRINIEINMIISQRHIDMKKLTINQKII